MEEEQAKALQTKKDEVKKKAEDKKRQKEQEEADWKVAREKEEREREAAKKKSAPKKSEPTRKVWVEKAGKDWKHPLGQRDDKERELRDGDLQAGECFSFKFSLLILIFCRTLHDLCTAGPGLLSECQIRSVSVLQVPQNQMLENPWSCPPPNRSSHPCRPTDRLVCSARGVSGNRD